MCFKQPTREIKGKEIENMTHKRIVLTALTLIASNICCTIYANTKYSEKTFLATRPQGENSAMEYTTWHRHAYMRNVPARRTHLQVVPFYQKSEKSDDLGTYFGVKSANDVHSFKVGNSLQLAAKTVDIENDFLIHDSTNQIAPNMLSALSGTISFSPQQTLWGLRLDWFQDIGHVFGDFFFRVSTPVVHASNKMRMSILNPTDAVVQVDPAGGGTNENFSLQEFFTGQVSVNETAASTNLQNPLTKGKIANKRERTGFADIDFSLGYKVHECQSHHIFVSVDGTLPTGNKATGEYLFEPIIGNGNHFALGGSVDAGATAWENCWGSLRVVGSMRYKYLFENTQQRLLGLQINDPAGTSRKFGQYYLIGDITNNGANQTNKPLFPAANILAQNVMVTPGHTIDGLVMLSAHACHWTIDLGYNLFWKNDERVVMKDTFPSDTYGIANPIYDTSAAFDPATEVFAPINPSTPNNATPYAVVDINSAKTPTIVTHKIVGGLAYSCKSYDRYPWSIGLGGSYEFQTDNDGLENYAFWAKANLSF